MRCTLILFLFLMPGGLHAAGFAVPVTRLDPDLNLAAIVSAARTSTSAEVQGAGDLLTLSYTSAGPVDLFVFPVQADDTPDTDAGLIARLPQGIDQEALIDLTVSPAWGLRIRRYRMHALSRAEEAPRLHQVLIARGPDSFLAITGRQFLRGEPYEPSSYHRLRGYRFLDVPLGAVLGCALLCTAIVMFALRRMRMLPSLLLAMFLLYGARVGTDLIRMSTGHLRAWAQEGTYAAAGSSFALAEALSGEEGSAVFLCHDGSSYLPTLLGYLLYPRRLVSDPVEAQHAIVMQKVRWGEGPDVLQCGDTVILARRMQSFPDGSVLFRILSS